MAEGVWVRQSEWAWTKSIVVRGAGVGPGRSRHRWSELNELADDLDRLGIPVVAGFSIHPHWDHLLWRSRFGDVPRFATGAGTGVADETRERQQAGAAEGASGIPLELIANENGPLCGGKRFCREGIAVTSVTRRR